MAIDVSEQSVRDLLDNPAAKSVKTPTVEGNISRSKRIIEDVKDPAALDTRVEDAVRAMAVWLTYGSYMEGIAQQLGNISNADRIKLDHLRKVAEFFVNAISKEPIDLDIESISSQSLLGIPPAASAMTNTEAYFQSS